jgi:hypothetical protein
MNLLRVRRSGVLSRHRHRKLCTAWCKGRWRYLEHDWEAAEGSYVFEPPGETHTLYVPEDVEEMITCFQGQWRDVLLRSVRNYTGYEDVFTKVDMCRKHFSSVGLGEDFVDQFIR